MHFVTLETNPCRGMWVADALVDDFGIAHHFKLWNADRTVVRQCDVRPSGLISSATQQWYLRDCKDVPITCLECIAIRSRWPTITRAKEAASCGC